MIPPLSLRLHQARMRIMKTVNDAAADNELSAILIEGVLSSVLAEVRARSTAELIIDMSSPEHESEYKKERKDK